MHTPWQAGGRPLDTLQRSASVRLFDVDRLRDHHACGAEDDGSLRGFLLLADGGWNHCGELGDVADQAVRQCVACLKL